MACNIIWLSEPLFNQPSDDILTLKDDADPRLQTRHFTVSQISVPNTLPETFLDSYSPHHENTEDDDMNKASSLFLFGTDGGHDVGLALEPPRLLPVVNLLNSINWKHIDEITEEALSGPQGIRKIDCWKHKRRNY
ncbi:hypothetical protein SNK03_009895 [Fusarium graminearum]|uniref:Uncharacterized protein n=1 Tax=Gibberella zeae TaxID=5518 RepID=A0A679NHU1_GIBZA|nr:unnamed protein product [Fusarium graminearum]CZS74419.1 unnamed protein product [Fusarium graminearum]